jgi:hypothetical protein
MTSMRTRNEHEQLWRDDVHEALQTSTDSACQRWHQWMEGGTNGWKQEQGVQQARVVWIYMNIWSYFFNVLPTFTLKTFLYF